MQQFCISCASVKDAVYLVDPLLAEPFIPENLIRNPGITPVKSPDIVTKVRPVLYSFSCHLKP